MKTLEIIHVGISVSNMEKSLLFYRDILGLDYQGQLIMEGPATDALFAKENCRVKVAYLNGSEELYAPPVELLEFLSEPAQASPCRLDQTSISEICFRVDDLEAYYQHLLAQGVECLSAPQTFDFTKEGFGKSKALYFKDPDGIILEAMEILTD